MNVSELSISKEKFLKVSKKISRNDEVVDFYDFLFEETEDFSHYYRAKAVHVCGKFWDIDWYRLQQVKDIKRVYYCHDKFCKLCQSKLAQARQEKYAPILDQLSEDYTLCHMVITIPNVTGGELLPIVKKMYEKFKHLTRFLSGNKKVRGVDFTRYGYVGALRALEITFKKFEDDFHPHFHTILLLRKGIDFGKPCYKNHFSYDKSIEKRRFTAFEVLLQKIWFLLMNDITVTKQTIEDLKEGYSVYSEPVKKGEYHEIFKYVCKGAFDDGTIYNEEVLRVLYYSLRKKRMIQGYGILHGYRDEESELIEEERKRQYEEAVKQLQVLEDPLFQVETLEEIISDQNCRYISRSRFKHVSEEEKEE